ncbi:non-ribosomal peptide synthetase [Chitinophaga varians]|uniref:non-ribosomal peptide synthetase n=1 Tax=Chitinophaga varians TaxID=2202339 RepID=UPI00165FC92A|nr:non-ribosomal peptide synthetase [Chitinophaga varians]MBC9914694.1 amino acid adenylation domain-containing protein [Chitinophaga varians]
MNTALFLKRLQQDNIRLKLIDDQLKIVGNKALLTGPLLEEIRERRDEIIHHLLQKQIIPFAGIKDSYPLSAAQTRFFFLQQVNPLSTAYNLPQQIFIGPVADKEKIRNAFQQLIKRHDNFRTSFRMEDGIPVQVIHDDVYFELEENTTDFIRPFDLSKAPLLRAALVIDDNGNHVLQVDTHHIANDGISCELIGKELADIYQGNTLPPVALRYVDFAEWENSDSVQEQIADQEQYWLERFSGTIPVLELPADHPRPSLPEEEGERIRFVLSKKESMLLKQVAASTGMTTYMTVFAIFSLLVSKLSGQSEVVVGMPVSGRIHPALDNIAGVFINTLAIKVTLNDTMTLHELMVAVKGHIREAFNHQQYPFEKLVEKLGMDRIEGRNPIFDVQVNLLNYGALTDDNGQNEEAFEYQKAVKRFDLSLNMADGKERIIMDFQYWVRLFERSTVERFIGYFRNLIWQLEQCDERVLGQVHLMGNDEEAVVRKLSAGATAIKGLPVHELFRQQVNNRPDRIALVYEGQQWTYRKVDEVSGKLASRLVNRYRLQKGDIAGIVLDRSPAAIIAILAVLKSGAAYLPIDHQYPAKRIQLMLQDAGARMVIADSRATVSTHLPVLLMDQEDYSQEEEIADVDVSPVDVAYVIYTSGSTGTPKGVVVAHESLTNYTCWANKYYFGDNREYHFALLTSLSFDLTITGIFTTLLRGDQLHIFDSQKNWDEIIEILRSGECQVNALKLTPSHIRLLGSHLPVKGTVDTIILGGEMLTAVHINAIKDVFPSARIFNEYGPTEATVGCTVHEIVDVNDLSIGRPVDGAYIYILNAGLQLQPIGVWGDIYIGGIGVAKGYLHHDTLTAERFIPDLFHPGGRMYKTGDIGRWLPSGTIAYRGRSDEQVKVRGYRIEPGEIEQAIMDHEKVKACVVVIKQYQEEEWICCYFTSTDTFAVDEVRNYVTTVLPVWMVPQYFIQMEQFPLTINGKLDKTALPSPFPDGPRQYTAPEGEVQEKLALIWSEVLGIDLGRIGVNNRIFEFGGHSLMILKILVQIRHVFQVSIKVQEVYKSATIATMARIIERKKWSLDNETSDSEPGNTIII